MHNRTFCCLAIACITSSAAACRETEPTSNDTAALTGAIFTTLADGSAVDANIYDAKEDVYLDGGPGSNAPSGAGALPEGDYYFQVTDPSGDTLLSTDAIECRSFHVTEAGLIDGVNPAGGCEHATGLDADHGAVTVQLMPYDDTPNPGGEYKAWATRVDDYEDGEGKHGFVANDSKTDNFKVLAQPPPHPACGNGVEEGDEECDDGNSTDGDGCSANCIIELPPPPRPRCGNGILEGAEQCDDGNSTDGDGCSANCTSEPPPPPACGNGVLEGTESCDDGNSTDGDGCSADCTIEPPPPPPPCCGNGVLEGDEECDDGNMTSGDGCSSDCKTECQAPPD